jgi:hypothetical protein
VTRTPRLWTQEFRPEGLIKPARIADIIHVMDKNHQYRLICLILIVATIAVYAGVLGAEFTNRDDNLYVVDNPHVQAGLTPSSVAWAFTATH